MKDSELKRHLIHANTYSTKIIRCNIWCPVGQNVAEVTPTGFFRIAMKSSPSSP